MASEIIHSGALTPAEEGQAAPAEEYRIVKLSERHGPEESETLTAAIWIKGAPGPVNRMVELRRVNTTLGSTKFGLTHPEQDALVMAYLESLSDEEYKRLLGSVSRTVLATDHLPQQYGSGGGR